MTLYNKSELIAYYGHVSAHKLPNDTGYLINIIEFDTKPDKAQLDLHYKEKIPLIIKFNTEIWIYGFDNDGSTKLKKSSNTDPYSSLSFSKKIELAKQIPNEVYQNIKDQSAHSAETYIGTHAVVVRNSGKLTAKNVRLGHQFLPNYTIYPNTKYEITDLPGGGKEIYFPVLVPNEQITISYLYFAPINYSNINTYVKSDEGLAKVIKVIPTPSISTWIKVILYILLFIGFTTTIYLGIISIAAVIKCTLHTWC